jgi:cobalamin synthase
VLCESRRLKRFAALIYAFGIEAYTTHEGASAVVVTLLLFGPSVAAFTYCVSYLFSSHSTAQNTVLFLNFITGTNLFAQKFLLSVYVLRTLPHDPVVHTHADTLNDRDKRASQVPVQVVSVLLSGT